MAEKNKNTTPFEDQQIEMKKQVAKYKLGSEASIVAMIYKNPDLLRETNLSRSDFSNNCWRVYFEIIKDIIIVEKKVSASEVDVGLYLDKHPKLADKYLCNDKDKIISMKGLKSAYANGEITLDEYNEGIDELIDNEMGWLAFQEAFEKAIGCEVTFATLLIDNGIKIHANQGYDF